MKYFKLFSVLLLSMFVLSATRVYAGQHECNNDPKCVKCEKCDKSEKGGKRDFDKVAKELNLTDAQKQRLKEHREKHQAQMKDMMKQTMEKNEALRQELQKPDSDKAKIDALKFDLKELGSKRIDAMTEGVSEMKQILTPEQFKKMNENMEKRHQKMKKMMDKKFKHAHPEGGTGTDGLPPEG